MPSAMVGNNGVQSASPELGSGNHSEVMKQVLGFIDKKVRNMEKKKGKLDDYQAKKNKGDRLNQDQLDALSKFQEITNNLEFARELQKSFLTLGQDIQKAVKKSARREQLQREEMEQRRLKTVLELQFLLDRLGDDTVRQDLKRADASGSPLLSEADLTALDHFYKLVGPERDHDVRLTDQYEEASLHLWELLEGRDKAVAGTTYKALKETLDKVLLSDYFDRVQPHQNGLCEEEEEEEDEEEEEQAVAPEESEAGDQPAEPEGTVTEEYTETIEVEATEFVNRQFIPDSTYSSTEKDQVEEWAAEAQVVSSLQHQALAQEPPHTVNSPSPAATPDPVVRKQAVQDLMAQMQGTYNFMQDSMLEFDGQALDPAIVSAQPMKPGHTVDLQQLACAPVHTESRIPQTGTVPGQPEPTQASMSLSSEQPPAPSSLPSAFPPVSKPPHSGGINVNAAPFQSMQAVFNMNAPVPPTNDGDSLKHSSQFPSGYSQSFNSQSEHSVEQPDNQQEALQSVVPGFLPQEQAGGHQQGSQQASGFGRNGQAFYNSRAAPRGGPRNARGVLNGYRGSNGFRGGYDGYRPPFSNTPNSGYGQTQFTTPRDYSNTTYQREGYQPGYKRGAAQGPRGISRGRGGTSHMTAQEAI